MLRHAIAVHRALLGVPGRRSRTGGTPTICNAPCHSACARRSCGGSRWWRTGLCLAQLHDTCNVQTTHNTLIIMFRQVGCPSTIVFSIYLSVFHRFYFILHLTLNAIMIPKPCYLHNIIWPYKICSSVISVYHCAYSFIQITLRLIFLDFYLLFYLL